MATVGGKPLENWDEDLDLEGPILAHSASAHQNSVSFSSRLSIRSESNAGDEDWNIALGANDEQSTTKAISSAKLAGIPLPANVPPSALLGGSIKRLGKSKPAQHNVNDDWGDDLELPEEANQGLKIKPQRQDNTTTAEDVDDLDWADGSLGVRFGGTRRASKNRTSSVSAVSPSMGSCMTMESEEDGLRGLVLPTEPLDFEAALKKRQAAPPQGDLYPAATTKAWPNVQPGQSGIQKDDFFEDIDFGNGDIFDPRKKTLNRNVKQNWKPLKDASPVPKTQTTLTFTKESAGTRIPRPVTTSRPKLEPVFESGATSVSRSRRPEPTTTSAQLLRSKRSLPALRQNQPLPKAPPLPFHPIPSSPSQARQPHARTPQHGSRRDSDPYRPQSPTTLRAHSRLSATATPDTPTRPRRDMAPAALAREAAARRTMTKPARKRNFGDGTELDTFDDLPTSAAKESLYLKQPSSRPNAKALRPQQSQSRLGFRDKVGNPIAVGAPKSPTKEENLPRFARDTTASRIAREQRLGLPKPRTEGPLAPRPNWPSQVAARTPLSSPSAHRTTRKGPQLVTPMGKENIRHFEDDAAKKGMRWNAVLCKWEGNENEVLGFETPAPPSPPRPALITNITGSQGVQVVGGMVFDPQRMCWLKLGATPQDAMSASIGEEEDPFRDIEDLPEAPPHADGGSVSGTAPANGGGSGPGSEWLVGEEFDLGPEFIRRQREEEVAWRARVSAWFGEDRDREGEGYKWAIRDIAAGFMV